jgi:hypothetical protein
VVSLSEQKPKGESVRYIIIAPTCNVPLRGTDPEPNRLILRRALELSIELTRKGYNVAIFTDDYMREPVQIPDGVAFVQAGPKGLRSQVAFLGQLRLFLKESDTLVAVITPHYRRRFRRDVRHIIGKKIPIDGKLLKLPISEFFSENGADPRSRSLVAWKVRELVIWTICLFSWKLYAKLTG